MERIGGTNEKEWEKRDGVGITLVFFSGLVEKFFHLNLKSQHKQFCSSTMEAN